MASVLKKSRPDSQPAQRGSRILYEVAKGDAANALKVMESQSQGLTDQEVAKRQAAYGKNEVAHEKPPAWWVQLGKAFYNPFIGILVLLVVVSLFTDVLYNDQPDFTTITVLSTMITISGLLRFWQEFRSQKAAEALKAMVRTTATVSRATGTDKIPRTVQREVPLQELVPGDIVHLSAGDMIPADVRLLTSKDLFVSQSVLTGESMPVEKYDTLGDVVEKSAYAAQAVDMSPLETGTLCFMGTNTISGSATAVVVATGNQTFFGSMARSVLGQRAMTSFDKGVNKVSWLLIKFMVVMVPIVFLINGLVKGNWMAALLFALAVAVGLTPEMLPLIVSANLAKGAVKMSKKKVIVKRLNSIQNFGAMDILCTDKTGTLTEDKVVLVKHLDVRGDENDYVLGLAYLNSSFQTGLKNLLDRGVIEHTESDHAATTKGDGYRKIDEIPFDFMRRRMSVIVQKRGEQNLLICKGALEEILSICTHMRVHDDVVPLNDEQRAEVQQFCTGMNADGLRVLAVAYRYFPATKQQFSVSDESQLVLSGYLGFLDPAKSSAPEAIRALTQHGVQVKILTGDNDIVTTKICREVGMEPGRVVLGHEIDAMSEEQLSELAERTSVFAKMNPVQKARVIRTLKSKGHTVGYMGDGINDAAALRDADVGISVDTAVDIAKESADIILLEKSLMVLEEGVIEGRNVFGNIIKYIKMTASSNFGNVFSVLVASAFLPFEPMTALMLLVQNLLYEFSQLALPWDRMDKEFLERPRKWESGPIAKFMVYIGPLSSIFDITTFLLMWHVFNAHTDATAPLFQSGWFVEGLLSQTLIVHMIRTQKIPFFQSAAAWPVLLATGAIMALGLVIPFTGFGASIGLVPLPWSYFPWLVATLLGYCVLTQVVKTWFIRRFQVWL